MKQVRGDYKRLTDYVRLPYSVGISMHSYSSDSPLVFQYESLVEVEVSCCGHSPLVSAPRCSRVLLTSKLVSCLHSTSALRPRFSSACCTAAHVCSVTSMAEFNDLLEGTIARNELCQLPLHKILIFQLGFKL
jgi:hypothetical protein